MNIEKLRSCILAGRYQWRKHTLVRLAQRKILQETVLQAIKKGEIIEDYPEDKPFPSCLILGWVKDRPYHVVIALDSDDFMAHIITAYEPSPDRFGPDFKTRRSR